MEKNFIQIKNTYRSLTIYKYFYSNLFYYLSTSNEYLTIEFNNSAKDIPTALALLGNKLFLSYRVMYLILIHKVLQL